VKKHLLQIWFWLKRMFAPANPLDADVLVWDSAPMAKLLLQLREEPLLRPYLGIGECKTLLQSISNGHGLQNAGELETLLAALLVKNKADRVAVPQILESFLQKRNAEIRQQMEEAIRLLEAKKTAAKSQAKATERPQWGGEETSPPPAPTQTSDNPGSSSTTVPTYQTSVQVELMLSPKSSMLTDIAPVQSDNESTSIVLPPQGHRFILTEDYQPVSRRQMDQIWRFLRKPSHTGGRAENLDLQRTVARIARNGWLDQPEWQRNKLNKVHLVLLIDHSSSMLAWHGLGRQLIASAIQGGGHKDAEVFWFSNLPHQFESAVKPGLLFKDSAHTRTEKMDTLLRRCSKQNTEVLIFSDGGAARGGLNEKRAEHTKVWLQILKRNVSSVAWLNPMPHTRWWGSTAILTTHETAMFEADQRGLMAAINHLRGR
jgi:uncharacterized protein with von Willebrand factor type A (vWA) domain